MKAVAPTRSVRRAAGLYQRFREERPKRAIRVPYIKPPRAMAVIGIVELIAYVTTHGRRVRTYMHEFAPGSRPYLAAGTKKGQVYLIGGRYKVTERGIVDLDRNGRTVREGRARYEVRRLR